LKEKGRIEGGLSNVDCESRSGRGKPAQTPLDRLIVAIAARSHIA
jgi:hypothetical protein